MFEDAQPVHQRDLLVGAFLEQDLARPVAEPQQLGVGLAEVEDRQSAFFSPAHARSPFFSTLAMMTFMPASVSMRSSSSARPSSVISVAMRDRPITECRARTPNLRLSASTTTSS